MGNILQITDMLELEIEKDKTDKDDLYQYQTLIDLYKEILMYTDDIDKLIANKENTLMILDMIDKNIALQLTKKLVLIEWYKQRNLIDLDEYKNAIKVVNQLLNKINKKYQELNDRQAELKKKIEDNKEKITIFKIILTKIKFKQYIPYKIVNFFEKYLEEKDFSPVEQIKLLEIINIYNRNVYERIHNYPQSYKNEVLDMISFGFEIIEDDNLDYNKEIERKVELHYSLLKYQKDFNAYFEEINQELQNENDLRLFYVLMIKKIQGQIFETISLIKMKEFYIDLETKKEIIYEYKHLIDLYLKFRNKYFNIISKDEEKIETSDIQLIFAQDANSKPYIMKDLKNVNNEYLSKIGTLLTSLINGTLTNKNIEGFTSQYKGFRKLKDDQIRIVIRPINPKLYCIMGVGVKKDNTGNVIYSTLCGRKYPTSAEEISKLLEESTNNLQNIEQYITENRRRGNR